MPSWLTPAAARHFAEERIAAWNAHHLPRALAHDHDAFKRPRRASSTSREFSGSSRGKEAVGVDRATAAVALDWTCASSSSASSPREERRVLTGSRNQAGRLAVEASSSTSAGS